VYIKLTELQLLAICDGEPTLIQAA
jgi:hypothetical protein